MKTEKDSPLVSIVIPTYNYADYLPRAIQSCLDQSYRPLEIIVVDDGSTDNTKNIIDGYNEKIIYVRQKNSGVSSARNRGLELAGGNYIAFLDADDYLTKNAIRIRLEALFKNPLAGSVITETYSLKNDKLYCKPGFKNNLMSDKFHVDLLTGKFPFGTCALLIRSDIAKKFRFPPGISNGEDIVYFSKIFFAAPVYYLTEPTAITVWHGDSLRHNIEELKRQGEILAKIIFDDPFYNGTIEYIRKDFIVNRHMEFFRKLYLSGENKIARKHYIKAISLSPERIFKIGYLIKFIKSFF